MGYLRPGTAQLSSGCPADEQNTPPMPPFMLKFQNKTSQLKPRQTIISPLLIYRGFPGVSDSKESACNANDLSLIPVSGRSPEEVYGNPLQYSCLENSMERGAWRATVHRVVKSQIQLSKTLSLFVCVCVCVCVCVYNFYYFLVTLCSMQDLCSPTRDQTCAPAVEDRSLNHWTTREVPPSTFSDADGPVVCISQPTLLD